MNTMKDKNIEIARLIYAQLIPALRDLEIKYDFGRRLPPIQIGEEWYHPDHSDMAPFINEDGSWKRDDKEWISLDEKWPEQGIDVLVFAEGKISQAWWDRMSSHFGDWYDVKNASVIEGVTHWMPLPSPPTD